MVCLWHGNWLWQWIVHHKSNFSFVNPHTKCNGCADDLTAILVQPGFLLGRKISRFRMSIQQHHGKGKDQLSLPLSQTYNRKRPRVDQKVDKKNIFLNEFKLAVPEPELWHHHSIQHDKRQLSDLSFSDLGQQSRILSETNSRQYHTSEWSDLLSADTDPLQKIITIVLQWDSLQIWKNDLH